MACTNIVGPWDSKASVDRILYYIWYTFAWSEMSAVLSNLSSFEGMWGKKTDLKVVISFVYVGGTSYIVKCS